MYNKIVFMEGESVGSQALFPVLILPVGGSACIYPELAHFFTFRPDYRENYSGDTWETEGTTLCRSAVYPDRDFL
jgi:hypothetical protein